MNIDNRSKNMNLVQLSKLEWTAFLLIVSGPLLYLSVPHWITNTSVLAVILILFLNFSAKDYFNSLSSRSGKLIASTYIIYIFAIVFSQLGRGDFKSTEFLDQSRWLVGIPIFFFLLNTKIDFSKILDWICPLALLFSYISSTFILPSDAWGSRATIKFMDPLAFGYMNLSLALMCLASMVVDFYEKKANFNTAFKCVGFAFGMYISIRTGSRTGWFAFPLLLVIFSCLWKSRGVLQFFGLFLLCALFIISTYIFSPIFETRINSFFQEFMEYPWSGGVGPETSVGLRIAFYRLGFYYYSQSPMFGWGDRGYISIKDAMEVASFSSQYTRDFAFNALFHSEWVTQAVRYGVLGLIGVFWVFFVPLKLFFIEFQRRSASLKAAMMGLSFVLCQLVASLSTEIYSSKGMITLNVIITGGLLATIMHFNTNRN